MTEPMIFVTGDTHSDFRRFNTHNFPVQKEMTKEDVVIICGDFGGVWSTNKDEPFERYWLNWLNDKPFTTCFCDGNHENFDRLNNFPTVTKFGAEVHQIRSSIFHLVRGNVYDIQGERIFVFGGAHSHDISDGVLEADDPRVNRWRHDASKMYRVNHVSWWKEEIPSYEEMQYAKRQLEKHDWKVDVIITHTPPSSILRNLGLDTDDISEFLERVKETTEYKEWFCGHVHIDRNFLNNKARVLCEDIALLKWQ